MIEQKYKRTNWATNRREEKNTQKYKWKMN